MSTMTLKSVKSQNPCESIPDRHAGVIQTIYDIVKAHGGEIRVETKEAHLSTRAGTEGEDPARQDEGSMFVIQLADKQYKS